MVTGNTAVITGSAAVITGAFPGITTDLGSITAIYGVIPDTLDVKTAIPDGILLILNVIL
jgi:hypothetical protein